MNTHPYFSLIANNIEALSEGLALLEQISDGSYLANHEPLFQSTLGQHFRHLIEHYQCLMQQIASGELSYDLGFPY